MILSVIGWWILFEEGGLYDLLFADIMKSRAITLISSGLIAKRSEVL